jgi:hypothetical protein
MPPQRGGRPANQTVANNFQQVIVPGRRNTVQCLHRHRQWPKELLVSRVVRELKKKLRYTQGEMKDRLLQKEL